MPIDQMQFGVVVAAAAVFGSCVKDGSLAPPALVPTLGVSHPSSVYDCDVDRPLQLLENQKSSVDWKSYMRKLGLRLSFLPEKEGSDH